MIHVMHHSSDLTTRKISQPRCMKNVNFPSLISIPFSPVASVAHSVARRSLKPTISNLHVYWLMLCYLPLFYPRVGTMV